MNMTTEKITKYLPSHSMRQLISDNAMLLPAISRFDIAFGFGDAPISRVCRDNDVDPDTFLCVCNLLSGYDYDASSISLDSLMRYLERAHSSILEVELPDIKHHLIDAVNLKETNEVAMLLIRFYDDYVEEVRRHMEYENDIIFKYVRKLMQGEVTPGFSISQYSTGHIDTGAKLNDLKDIFIHHYKHKDNVRLSKVLLSIIECEQDMLSHFEVESRLLVPAALKLEHSMMNAANIAGDEKDAKEEDADSGDILSEREKDIVRGIARGKVNKEIADELCISVHTVATHRRNISNKLDIHSTAGLAIYAIINHLVELDEVRP